jgi:hypothetical protein
MKLLEGGIINVSAGRALGGASADQESLISN